MACMNSDWAPPQDVVIEFTEGNCMLLAICLHDTYGFGLVSAGDMHALVRLSNGKYLDITGVLELRDILNEWPVTQEEVLDADREELMGWTSPFNEDWDSAQWWADRLVSHFGLNNVAAA